VLHTENFDMGVDRDRDDADAMLRLRLLECWLPLAQQLNQDLGWGCDARGIERLIVAAAAELAQTDSATTARAVLWRQYLRERREPA
jgi:hypothetical protein